MLTFLLLVVRQLQAHFTSLLWFDVPTGRLGTPLATWHRLLYAPTATRHRLYLSGLFMLFLAPVSTQAQLISISPPTSICAGQTTTLAVSINLPAAIPLNLLNITATAPEGLTATVGALTNRVNATISVTTSPTITTGTKSLTVTATAAGLVPLSVFVDVPVTGLPIVSPNTTLPVSATVGSLLTLGSCPIGSVLSYTVTNTSTGLDVASGIGLLALDANVAGQSVRIACNGTCSGLPTTFALPSLPSLGLGAPSAVCAGTPFSLTLVPSLGLDLSSQAGVTITAATPSGALDVGLLGSDGVLTINGGILTAGNPTSVTVTASVGSLTLISASVNINVLEQPVAPTQPGTLTATAGGVLSLTSLCPTTTALITGTIAGSGSILIPTTATGTQSLSVVCSNGTCLSVPTIVDVLVNQPLLGITVPTQICAGAPLSLSLVPTGFSFGANSGITLTATTPNGALTIDALGTDGVLTINNTGILTVGNPTSVTVTALLNNVPLVSASVNVNVLAQPAAPTQPGTLTATVGSVLSLTGLCPVSTTLTTGALTGSGSILVPTVTAGIQNLTVLCSNGTCLSLPTVVGVDVVTPIISASASAAICFGQPLSLTVLPGNFNLADGIVSIAVSGPLSLSASAIDNNGVITITGLPAGNQNLTITASIAGNPLASVQVPVSVNAIPAPTVVTASGGSYPAGVSSLTVAQNTGGVLFNVSCSSGTSSYTGTGGLTGSGDFTVSTSTLGVYSYSVVCTNAPCVSPATVVSVTVVTPANQAPVLTGTPITSPQTATVGVGFSTPTAQAFNDPDGGPLTYSATPLPAGIAINPQTGDISGTASTTVGSPFSVMVTATDPQQASVSTTFILNVVEPAAANQSPVLTGVALASPQTATVNASFSTPTAQAFRDPEGGPLTYSAGPLPAGITIDVNSGVISGIASTTVGSPFSVTVTATDNQQASVSTSFVLNVVEANQAPVLTGTGITSPQTATVGVGFTTTTAQAFNDPEGGTLTYTATPLPSGIAINPQTGVISGTPSTTVGSPFSVTVTATDPQQASVSASFVLNVVEPAAANQPPVLTGVALASPQTATVNASFSTPTAQAFRDPEGGPLTYSAGPLPAGITIDVNSGVISGIASTTVGSPFSVTVTATDNQQASVSASFVLNVVSPAAVNQSPVLTGTGITSPQTATVGVGFSTPTAQAFNDPDGGPLTYSTSPLPTGLAINPSTGVISGTPSTTVGSPFTITVTATDPQQASVSTNFVLNVVNPSVPPTTPCGSTNLNGAPLQATMPNFTCDQIKTSGNIQFTATGGSVNGGPIEYKAIGVTDWTTNCQQIIDRETRTACDAAPIEIQVRQLVNGSYVYGTSYVFDIRRVCPIAGCGGLPAPNRAPVVSAGIPNQVATVGQIFQYNIPANAFVDPDGDELLYMSSRLPDSFTFSSGFFGAYPTTAEVLSVTVTAYDNSGGMVSTTFTITVNPNPGSNTPSNPNPPTNPPATTCGSTNLDNSTLRAMAPNVDCEQLKTSGNIQFTATGGNANGGPIEFRAIGVTDWTTNCQQIIDRETRTACDAAPIEIQVRQLVNGSYVYGTSFSFNIRAVCPVAGCGSARVAAEAKAPLDVRVLGNPTRDESVSVDIRGAEGQRLQLMVVDLQGFMVSEHTVDNAGTVEHQTLKLGRQAGTYLLRVQSQTQVQTVKVLKQ